MKIEKRMEELAENNVYIKVTSYGNYDNSFGGRILHRFEEDKGLEYVSKECPVDEVEPLDYQKIRKIYFKSVIEVANLAEIFDDLPQDQLEKILEKHRILDHGLGLVYDFYLVDQMAFANYLEIHVK